MINIGKFSKIRGESNSLKNPKNNQNKKISKKSAFSLIELSIVLIIIGLLVAGITGGASLIDSARLKALSNEVDSYKQAVMTFMTIKGRLPGDLDNDGILGENHDGINEVYTSSSFQEPYNITPAPDAFSAPFIELYLEKIINFKPTPGDNSIGKGLPYSKVLKNFHYKFSTFLTDRSDNSRNYWWFYNLKLMSPYLYARGGRTKYDVEIIKKFDVKFDDGVYNNGNIRSSCSDSSGNDLGDNSYDSAISGTGFCDKFIYNIGL